MTELLIDQAVRTTGTVVGGVYRRVHEVCWRSAKLRSPKITSRSSLGDA
jgi:hypothetical protein